MAANPVASASPHLHPIRLRVAISLLFLFNGVLFATWVSRLPAIQTSRDLTHSQLGVALLAIAFGALIAMPTTGWLTSRLGSRIIGIVTTIIYGLSLPLLAIVPNGLPFLSILFLFGIVHGALDVAINAQAVAAERLVKRPIMSSFHALFSGGGLAGAALGAWFAKAGFQPPLHFTIMAALLLLTALIGSFPFLFNDKPASASHFHSETHHPGRWTLPPLRMILIGFIAFCCMIAEGAMADWSAIFLRESTGSSESFAAFGYAAFSITMLIGRIFGDQLNLRFGPTLLVRSGGILAVLGLLLALVWRQPQLTLVGFALVGAGLSIIVPLAFSAAGHARDSHAGLALATVTTIGYFGFLIGPPIIGFAADTFDLTTALGLLVPASLGLVFLAPWLQENPQPVANTNLPLETAPDSSHPSPP